MVGAAKGTSNDAESDRYQPVVQDLYNWIVASPTRLRNFELAIQNATSQNIADLKDIVVLSDWLRYLESLLSWSPFESEDGSACFNRFCVVYFVLSQPTVYHYQNRVEPFAAREYTFVTEWIIRYNLKIAEFLDSPASLSPETLSTFAKSPSYCMSDYQHPQGGWRTFNEYFRRHLKPGHRPIASAQDSSIITSPADFLFLGVEKISDSSTVTAKGIHWNIHELLNDSLYGRDFEGGAWIHGVLKTSDYHRFHTPIGGKVLEARIIKGTHWAKIESEELPHTRGAKSLQKRRAFSYPLEIGYQFQQIRGVTVLGTSSGKVAIIAVGMGTVGSVVLTQQEGAILDKGDEIGYFQFGGSDVIVLFDRRCRFQASAHDDTHYKMGTALGSVSKY